MDSFDRSAPTVVANDPSTGHTSTDYESEKALEEAFIQQLVSMGYEYDRHIRDERSLMSNLRRQIEKLNNYTFQSDDEWNKFFNETIGKKNQTLAEKTTCIQGDGYLQLLTRADGTTKNIYLIDKRNIHNNHLQVINQYVASAKNAQSPDQAPKRDNCYDVTILVNGLPLVHIELKRRGEDFRKAFHQINRYQRESFKSGYGLFEFIQIFIISNGTLTKYYSNTTRNSIEEENSSHQGRAKKDKATSFDFTIDWADANNKHISDLMDFTQSFLAKHTLLNILTKYCVFTTENELKVMRPYQIAATEAIIQRIEKSIQEKTYSTTQGGGYIWHATGSGKTLTSFKTALLASKIREIDQVLFVVDRKDLDYQTMKEYDKYQENAANSSSSTAQLKKRLEDPDAKIIITTIQKLSRLIDRYPEHPSFQKHTVLIFDECHRSQFGDMHSRITKAFKKYHLFGFTGTPIFAANANTTIPISNLIHAKKQNATLFQTTEQTFGDRLHVYTIVDAINDNKVLPFHIDDLKTMSINEDMEDKEVYDIDESGALAHPERIRAVTEYILEHFNQKTYRKKQYHHSVLSNVPDVVKAQNNGKVDEEKGKEKEKTKEIWEKKDINGFNSIFAVSSVKAAMAYYKEFQRQMKADPAKALRVAMIYSYGTNEAMDEENSENTDLLDASSRDALENAIQDYNKHFHTNYDTSSEKFQNYYKDVSWRIKNKDIDLLIVVNMFLTGFDATTLNTLWVDKFLKMHGLIQAFSRTNRILNENKTFGNIVCFRNLKKQVDEAIALFGNKDAKGRILLRDYDDYYNGYEDAKGKYHPGYQQQVQRLKDQYPLHPWTDLLGEKAENEFILLFGFILRRQRLLQSFDFFEDLLSMGELQDYQSHYIELYHRKRTRGHNRFKEDISDDIVFEIELIRQTDINIDYILPLIEKYRRANCTDKELLDKIRTAVGGSPQLHSKLALLEKFLERINGEPKSVFETWQTFVAEERERQLAEIIAEERLKDKETRQFVADAINEGELNLSGTALDNLLPPMPRFGNKNSRSDTKQRVIEKLQAFLEQFSDLE